MRSVAILALSALAGFVAAQEAPEAPETPEETTTVVVPEETVYAIPTETTSWAVIYPDVDYTTIVTTTKYGPHPNATSTSDPEVVPTAAAGRLAVGGSVAALVGFGAAGLALL